MEILRAGQEVLGMSTGRKSDGDKYTWCGTMRRRIRQEPIISWKHREGHKKEKTLDTQGSKERGSKMKVARKRRHLFKLNVIMFNRPYYVIVIVTISIITY